MGSSQLKVPTRNSAEVAIEAVSNDLLLMTTAVSIDCVDVAIDQLLSL